MKVRNDEQRAVARNAQLKVRRYCTCGRKFIGNLAWASHMRWAEARGLGLEHRYNGTMPKGIFRCHRGADGRLRDRPPAAPARRE